MSVRPHAAASAVLAFSAFAMGVLLAPPASAQEPALKEIRFTAGKEDFLNPERGWYRYREMSMSGTLNFNVRPQNATLVFLKLRADAYRNADLPQAMLDRLDAAFVQARKDGVKVIPRVAYNDGPSGDCPAQYGCDAPKAVILRHIAQLGVLWRKHKDVIHLVDPGFIGGWGEWHTSSNGLDNKTDRTDILFAILDAAPADRMVYIRYPGFKREIFGGTQSTETATLKPEQAFDRSKVSRVGHLNDCFVSGENDVGTYQVSGWNRARELAWLAQEAPYVPYGGETCAVHARGECANTLAEMATLHIDHLNRDYHGDVISRWQSQGCLDTISIKLGHRLAVEWARLPDSVKPGGRLRIEAAIRNHGFGELFNPRDVEAVLYREGRMEAAVLPLDPRRWSGGTADTFAYSLTVPASLPEGAYKLGLRLADKDTALRGDPRYSVRFANPGWEEATGINVLKGSLVVSAQAAGTANGSVTRFEVVDAPAWVRAGTGKGLTGWRLESQGSGALVLRAPKAIAGPVEVELLSPSGASLRRFRAFPRDGAYFLGAEIWPKGVSVLSITSSAGRGAWTLVSGALR
jgi:hypothetical protein